MFPSPRTINNLTEELNTPTSHTMQKETDGGRRSEREKDGERLGDLLTLLCLVYLFVCRKTDTAAMRLTLIAVTQWSTDEEKSVVGEIRPS